MKIGEMDLHVPLAGAVDTLQIGNIKFREGFDSTSLPEGSKLRQACSKSAADSAPATIAISEEEFNSSKLMGARLHPRLSDEAREVEQNQETRMTPAELARKKEECSKTSLKYTQDRVKATAQDAYFGDDEALKAAALRGEMKDAMGRLEIDNPVAIDIQNITSDTSPFAKDDPVTKPDQFRVRKDFSAKELEERTMYGKVSSPDKGPRVQRKFPYQDSELAHMIWVNGKPVAEAMIMEGADGTIGVWKINPIKKVPLSESKHFWNLTPRNCDHAEVESDALEQWQQASKVDENGNLKGMDLEALKKLMAKEDIQIYPPGSMWSPAQMEATLGEKNSARASSKSV